MPPSSSVIWVPGGTAHQIDMRGTVAMRTLYLAPAGEDPRLAECRAIEVARAWTRGEVTMTEAGRDALRACDKAATAVEAEIFSCFKPGELETYRDLMQRLLASIRSTPDDAEAGE